MRTQAGRDVLIMTKVLIPYECRTLLGRSSLSFPGQQAATNHRLA